MPDSEKGSKSCEGGEYDPASMSARATEWMLAAKAGDQEAFDRLVLGLRGRAFHVARSLVGSREDAMDLTQETFMKVFKARETFKQGESFLPWFHRILRNTCFSFLRKKGRIRKRSLSAMGLQDEDATDYELVDEDAPRPDAGLEQTERSELFRTAMTTLSSKDREIISLRHFQELSYREIAESLDIPQGTVMSRLFHARRRLREALAGPLGETGELAGGEVAVGEDS